MSLKESILTPSKVTGRDRYWSVIKGICVLCVVFIHCTLPKTNGQVTVEWWLLRRLFDFPVGIFFVLAGYFVHLDRCQEKSYLWSKTKRLMIPYFVFSSLYLVRGSFVGATNYKGILVSLVLGTADVQMYFLLYLIQMILLLPLFKKFLVHSNYKTWFLLGLAALSMGWSWLLQYGLLPSVCSVLSCSYLFYYGLGIYIKGLQADAENTFIRRLYRYRYLWVSLGLGIAILETMPGRNVSQVTLGNYFYITSLVVAFFAVYWVKKPRLENRFCQAIAWLGDRSMAIYLIHMFPMHLMWRLEGFIAYPWLQIAEFTATMTMSILIVYGVQKIFKNQKWLRIIGF